MKISVVVPVYFNEDNLEPLYADLREKYFQTTQDDYELVLVDDGSRDRSWQAMKALADRDSRIRCYHLSRNFGSHSAILCGLHHATGDCAVVKAADLQEPTEMIQTMVDKWKQGNHVVLAVREGREEKKSQTLFANAYYYMVRKLAIPAMPAGGFDTFLLDRKVIAVLDKMDERNSAITGQILWAGFQTVEVPYVRQARTIGKSRWTLKKKIRLVSDTLFSFTTVPITVISVVGVASFIGSLLWALYVLAMRLGGHIPVDGFTTLFIFQLFSFGVTMLTLGILGGYLWRTFDSSRNRPVYIVEESYHANEVAGQAGESGKG